MRAWMRKHDLASRLLALLGAIVLWVFVIQVIDPVITRVVSIPVDIEGEETLAARKLVMTSEKNLTVDVTFEGNISIITEIINSPESYGRLVLNLSYQTKSVQNYVPPTWSWAGGDKPEKVTNVLPKKVLLRIEDFKEILVPVNLELTGEAPTGYEVESRDPNPAYVKVTGPSSKVESIAKAGVSYDIAQVRDTVNTSREVVFYDSSGMILDLTSDQVTIDSKTVDIWLDVTLSRTVNLEVEGYANYPDFLAKDAMVASISPSSLSITGEPGEVESVNRIELDEIDISAFLMNDEVFEAGYVQREIKVPNGVISDMNGQTATVYITFPGYVRQKLTIDTADLVESPHFRYAQSQVTLTLFGLGEDEQTPLITADTLAVAYSTDVEALEPGFHELEVTLQSSVEGVQVLGKYMLSIEVPEPVVEE